MTAPRIAVVHDYLTQRGGAERVVLSMMQAFPDARLVASLYEPASTFPEFAQFRVETSWLNRVPAFRADPRRALPLLAPTFSRIEIRDVDVVLCSSSGWAHGVRTDAPKLVYCYNPPRWLHQQEQYVADLSAPVRAAVRALTPALRRWDRNTAASADEYLGISRVVTDRIQRAYGVTARVLAPPVLIQPDAAQEPISGLEPGFLLTVSRARSYKNVELVCAAVETMPGERLVVVGGLPEGSWSPRLRGVADISDAQLRWLYANCSAVVAASHEDFGLTPIEGYAFGKPAACLRAGGFLDTMVESVTGVFIEALSPEAVRTALLALRTVEWSREKILRHAATYSPKAFQEALTAAVEGLRTRP